MQDSFLALRDSCRDSGRDWFPILFFSARVGNSLLDIFYLNLDENLVQYPE